MQAETQRIEMFCPEGARFSKITLRGSVDVSVSSQLLDAARQAAVAGRDTVVDGSEIERLDLSAVQILMSLSQAMKAGSFRIGAMSPAGRRFLEIAGVESMFPVEPEALALAPEIAAPAPAAEEAGTIEIAETSEEYDESAWDLAGAEGSPDGAAEAAAAEVKDEGASAAAAPEEREEESGPREGADPAGDSGGTEESPGRQG